MEEVRYHQIVSSEVRQWGAHLLDKLGESRFPKQLLKVAAGIAFSGMVATQVVSPETAASESQDLAAECIEPCDASPQASVLGEAVTVDTPLATNEAPVLESIPEIPVIEGVHPVVNERMRAMEITPKV